MTAEAILDICATRKHNLDMLTKEDVDFNRTAIDYARHRAGFPDSFFTRLVQEQFLADATVVVDLGTGTGTVARGLALRAFDVTGIDPAQSLLDSAVSLDKAAGVHVNYLLGRAEETRLPAQTFDIVTAGQCWHWFEQKIVLGEIRRLLTPRGKLIIAYFDWSPEAGPVEQMYRLLKKHNPAWKAGNWPLGFYPQKPGDLSFEGWRSIKSFLYKEDISYTHEAWRGRMRAYAGIGGSLSPAAVDAFDAEFAEALAKNFPHEPMIIPHKIWAEMWEMDA